MKGWELEGQHGLIEVDVYVQCELTSEDAIVVLLWWLAGRIESGSKSFRD